jgi:beta-glucosidase
MNEKNNIILGTLTFFLISCNLSLKEETSVTTTKSDKIIKSKVDSLLVLMTIEEKLGQLSQRYIAKSTKNLFDEIKNGKVGSLLNGRVSFYSIEERNRIQKVAVEESRLGIPIIFGHDVIHGFRTIFPTSLAQSCTWSPELIEKASAIAASEASASGVDWTFAPMIDVSRDPRWGRIAESYGEDTYLNAVFAVAAVNGFQGKDVANQNKLVSCLKHYVGYGAATGGRDYQYTDISKRSMHEIYLPPFEAGVKAGALTVMSAFNDINGVPATANKYYIREVLKNNMNFNGFVVSDWDAVEELIPHGIASDKTQAALLAITAGVDMEMKTLTYQTLEKSVQEVNKLKIIIDEAVSRVLFVKFKKGLFKNPYTDPNRIKTDILTPENRKMSRKIARESMVLLKNDGNILPLKNKKQHIAIVGPFAKETNLMGWWRSLGKNKELVTPYLGLLNNAPSGITISNKVTSKTDIIIACVGEQPGLFGENNTRSDIKLPYNQEDFLQELKKNGKPVVTIVFNGRPLDVSGILNNSDALLLAWHPGTEAGNALSDLLYGNYNPSGKLTTSFPKSVGQIPVYYNQRNSGRPVYSNYRDLDSKPLFPFGFGLSYSTFTYDSLKISSKTLSVTDSLVVSARITNNSKFQGNEVLQLYVRDLFGSTTRPVKELKGFTKIDLAPYESKQISFKLRTKDLTVFDETYKTVIEAGKFHVWIGPNSEEGLMGEFEVIQ